MTELFARLLQLEERMNRMAPRYGVYYATVRALRDDGIELDYLSTSQDEPSPPARLAAPMAGPGRGAFFRPEVGDEVVVGFEMGDVNRPVILGALWNDQHAPPSSADTSETNNTRTIMSRSGHQVTFDDAPGGGILIEAANGFHIRIDGDKIEISSGASLIAGTKIVLDGVSWNHQHTTGTGVSGPPQNVGV